MLKNEIAVISGKGGTGKTTLTISIIPFLEHLVVADADVDAPDLNILFDNTLTSSEDFVGLKRATIDESKCIHCGLCHKHCKFGAISEDIVMNKSKCEGCSVCEFVCPVGAITMDDYIIGKINSRETEYGTMIDARLIPGEEASGRLVSKVRELAKDYAEKNKSDYILIDGSPGTACNVIGAITGVDKVVIVTEPTLSGLHDLDKVLKLTKTFSLPAVVVINKCDIENEMTSKIKEYCQEQDVKVMLEIPFDKRMVQAISDKLIPSLTDIPFFQEKQWSEFIKYLKN